jgi:hypothetical protein
MRSTAVSGLKSNFNDWNCGSAHFCAAIANTPQLPWAQKMSHALEPAVPVLLPFRQSCTASNVSCVSAPSVNLGLCFGVATVSVAPACFDSITWSSLADGANARRFTAMQIAARNDTSNAKAQRPQYTVSPRSIAAQYPFAIAISFATPNHQTGSRKLISP